MRRLRTWNDGVLLMLLLVCGSGIMAGQTGLWVPTNVPEGGDIRSLARDSGGFIYAGTLFGIYRTADGGGTWMLCNRDLRPGRENLVVDSASNILVGSYGFWKSTDRGVTWRRTGLDDYYVSCLTVSSGGILFAGLGYSPGPSNKSPGGVFRSSDGGLTWYSYGLSGQSIGDLLLSQKHGLLANNRWAVFRRSENDTGWVKVSSTGGFSTCEDASGSLYVGREVDGVRKSTDGGVTWSATALMRDLTVYPLAVLSTGEIFAGVAPLDPSIPGGVYRTSDGGTSWSSLGLQDWAVGSLLPIDSQRLYVGSRRGVFRSSDGGTTWQQANGGISAINIRTLLCVDSLTVLAGTDVGVFRSTDNGQTWIESSEGIFPQSITCLTQDHKKNLFAGTGIFSPNGGVFKSTDGGLSWRCTSQDSIKGMYLWVASLGATKQNTLLAAVGAGDIYRSTDEGEHWTKMKRFTTRVVEDMAADSAGPVYGATRGDGVILSLDDGITWWVNPNPGLPDRSVICVAARVAGEVFAGGLWGVARSTNAGGSWTNISSMPDGSEVVALTVDRRGDVLGSTLAGGIFRSTDDGKTWLPDTAGLGGQKVHAFASAGGSTFATDSTRIYRRMSWASGVGSTDGRMPARVSLAQNYPNPFNPSTTIKYELPKASGVTLSVIDMLGREVAVLVNERRDAGVHEVKFDASDLSSGMYFYRLQAGDFVQTRKLLLLR